ncbi:MAG: hypothetical protein ACOC97_01845 [Myxococcota bacterium]
MARASRMCAWAGLAATAVIGGAACGASHSSGPDRDAGRPDDAGGAFAACEVDGVVYEHGSTEIDDPFSCNTCSCEDGALVCTEIACPEPCPDGTAPATSCSQCGPADGCEVVRTDCHSTCTNDDDCDAPLRCLEGEGVCGMICG